MGPSPRPLRERLEEKLVVTPSGCIEFQGATAPGGYGIIGPGARGLSPVRTHRVAWEIVYGPIPDGLVVCHRCDNPPCCNPQHLFLGTAGDNHADMVSKARNFVPTPPRGEGSWTAKLTDKAVTEIRQALVDWPLLNAYGFDDWYAKKFGVSAQTIEKVRKGRTWTHVNQGASLEKNLPSSGNY